MAMIDSSDFRLGLSSLAGETITLSLEGLSVNEKLVDARRERRTFSLGNGMKWPCQSILYAIFT